MSRALNFIIGLILGAAILWAVGLYWHIPGVKYSKSGTSSVTSTYSSTNNSSRSNNNGSSSNNQSTGSTQTYATLAPGFPTIVPIYKPSTVTGSTKTGSAYTASYTTSSSVSTVAADYKNTLATNGWKIANQTSNGSVTSYQATGNGENLTVTIQPATGTNTQSKFDIDVSPTQ